jgi:hypothetical protein
MTHASSSSAHYDDLLRQVRGSGKYDSHKKAQKARKDSVVLLCFFVGILPRLFVTQDFKRLNFRCPAGRKVTGAYRDP